MIIIDTTVNETFSTEIQINFENIMNDILILILGND